MGELIDALDPRVLLAWGTIIYGIFKVWRALQRVNDNAEDMKKLESSIRDGLTEVKDMVNTQRAEQREENRAIWAAIKEVEGKVFSIARGPK